MSTSEAPDKASDKPVEESVGENGSGGDALCDALIVSAFGRGNWLAQELARRGAHVTLIDASAAVAGEGEGAADDAYVDAEGPFGFFETPFADESQKQRLFDEGDAGGATLAARGACVWPADGPIEGRSEMSAYQIAARGLAPDVETYLRWAEPTEEATTRASLERAAGRARSRLAGEPFERHWLAAFAHQAFAAVYQDSARVLARASNLPSPLRAAFWTRAVSAKGAGVALATCQAAGVRVIAGQKIGDLRLHGRSVDAIETHDVGSGGASGVERAHAVVWCLSGAETHAASPRVAQTLFADGPAQADWRWMRARLTAKASPAWRALPPWTALVRDRFLPWTHDNLVILRKVAAGSAAAAEADVWLRLPSARAARNPEYAGEAFAAARALIAERVPGAEPGVAKLSREAMAGPERPPMQPVFAAESLGRTSRLRSPNLFYDGPETWETLDWNGAFARQAQILAEVEGLKSQRETQAAKEAAREAKAEARRLAKSQSQDQSGGPAAGPDSGSERNV